jgi:predicted nucleotidyltransferase
MRKLPIRLQKKKIENFCKKYHIIYLALFGSVLTPQFSKKSDVDILVKFEKRQTPGLFEVARMESELSGIIGRTVDLRTPNELSPLFRDDVLSKAKTVYGK